MGLLEKMRQFVGRLKRPKTAVLEAQEKEEAEAIQSPIQSIQSLDEKDSIDSIATEEAEEIEEKTTENTPEPTPEEPVTTSDKLYLSQKQKKPEPMLDKESFQVGLAAGYTGKSIKGIERSLGQIETQMITKDWFKLEFGDLFHKLLEMLNSMRKTLEDHNSSVQERFEAIQSAVEKMETVAKKSPEPIKEDILKEIQTIKEQIPLSPKMEELVEAIKSAGEMDYQNLAQGLGISVSALRGLLSNTLKRTDEIERFKKDGKGWVKVKSQ